MALLHREEHRVAVDLPINAVYKRVLRALRLHYDSLRPTCLLLRRLLIDDGDEGLGVAAASATSGHVRRDVTLGTGQAREEGAPNVRYQLLVAVFSSRLCVGGALS